MLKNTSKKTTRTTRIIIRTKKYKYFIWLSVSFFLFMFRYILIHPICSTGLFQQSKYLVLFSYFPRINLMAAVLENTSTEFTELTRSFYKSRPVNVKTLSFVCLFCWLRKRYFFLVISRMVESQCDHFTFV